MKRDHNATRHGEARLSKDSPPPYVARSSVPPTRFPYFVAQKPETLLMHGNRMGQDFRVITLSGLALLEIKDVRRSLPARRNVCDTYGNHLSTIRKRFLPTTFHIEDPSGKKMFELKDVDTTGSKFQSEVYSLGALSGKKERLVLLESSAQTYATIKHNGLPLAECELDSYKLRKCHAVKVAKGVDMALIAAICVSGQEVGGLWLENGYDCWGTRWRMWQFGGWHVDNVLVAGLVLSN